MSGAPPHSWWGRGVPPGPCRKRIVRADRRYRLLTQLTVIDFFEIFLLLFHLLCRNAVLHDTHRCGLPRGTVYLRLSLGGSARHAERACRSYE